MKKRVTIAIGVLLALAACFVAVSVGIAPLKNVMKDRARSEVARALPCGVLLGDVRVGLLRGVELRDVKLTETTAEGERRQFFQAKRIRLSNGLFGLFRNAPFNGFEIDRATILVVRDTEGRVNVAEILRAMGKRADRKSSNPRITLSDMRVDWLDFKSADSPSHEKFEIHSARLQSSGDGAWRVDELRARCGGTEARIWGSWNATPGRPVDLKIRLEPMLLQDMIRLARAAARPRHLPPFSLNGRSAFKGRIWGFRGGEQAEGTLRVFDGFVAGHRIRRAMLHFSPGTEGRIEFNEFSVRTDDRGLLLASGRITPGEPWTFEGEMTARRFPAEAALGAIMRRSPVTGATDGTVRFKGNASDTASIAGNGNIEIRDGLMQKSDVANTQPIPFRLISVDFAMAGGVARFSKARIESEDLHLDLDGTIGYDRTLDLSGRCEIAKGRVRQGFFRKLVSAALPDNEKGYRFPVHIGGTLDAPEIGVRGARTAVDGVQDNIRDAGNRIEKYFKKIF